MIALLMISSLLYVLHTKDTHIEHIENILFYNLHNYYVESVLF